MRGATKNCSIHPELYLGQVSTGPAECAEIPEVGLGISHLHREFTHLNRDIHTSNSEVQSRRVRDLNLDLSSDFWSNGMREWPSTTIVFYRKERDL